MLDCYPYATNELLQAAAQHRYLVRLSLASCSLVTDRGLDVIQSESHGTCMYIHTHGYRHTHFLLLQRAIV